MKKILKQIKNLVSRLDDEKKSNLKLEMNELIKKYRASLETKSDFITKVEEEGTKSGSANKIEAEGTKSDSANKIEVEETMSDSANKIEVEETKSNSEKINKEKEQVSTTISESKDVSFPKHRVKVLNKTIAQNIGINANKLKTMRAKNGMVGKQYSLTLIELGVENYIIHSIEGLEDIGLLYKKEESKIDGTPTKDGDHRFKITYTFDKDINKPKLDKELNILINPDPRSLWKEKEPSSDELYPKEHFDFQNKKFQEYLLLGASQRGRSHAHNGTFRDDEFVVAEISSNSFFICVADGAGSAKYSREGSRIGCSKSLDCVRELMHEQEKILISSANKISSKESNEELKKEFNTQVYKLVGETVLATRNAIIEKASAENHQLKDYSTTLLFSIVIKLENEFIIISYSIGDGIIAHISPEFVKPLSSPDGGEFAGQTRFLTMQDAIDTINERITIAFVEDISGLYLMTDGISDPYFETDSNFEKKEKWEELKLAIDEKIDFTQDEKKIEEQFKEWLGFWSQGNHDDRTIAFVK
jgi:hypothetical protein